MLRVAVISDTHSQHDKVIVPDCDVFIHSGDATNYGRPKELVSFLDWMGALPVANKLFVYGNHDKQIAKDMASWQSAYPSIDFLEHGLKIIGGFRFYGCASMWGYGESVETSESCDVFITHNAPEGILDEVPGESMAWGPSEEHIGDRMIHKTTMRLKPKYHVFGHIHLNGGRRLFGEHTTFINAAACGEDGFIARQCQTFDLKSEHLPEPSPDPQE